MLRRQAHEFIEELAWLGLGLRLGLGIGLGLGLKFIEELT